MHIFKTDEQKPIIQMPVNIAIFASGSGSNAENLIQYFKDSKEFSFPIIVSNKADAFVHTRAKKLEIPSFTFSNEEFREPDKILDLLHFHNIDAIVLAGFLLKVSAKIINAFPNKIINIHPALLPKYGGKGMYGHYVHEAVKAAGEKESGITIHYVNENYDEGNIIFQAKCAIDENDTPDDIAAKVHKLEYEYFPKVIEEVFSH
ncbi:Formyltetrahydrofolate-dependent phosphoribosylglycinamide formyltransferase [uncultured Paludibacter sp.]|nr:Formyltetrahydrofolate-dependent phosphoribosylglycinamide formyltransferase [uncultured Paludibacter sp.]